MAHLAASQQFPVQLYQNEYSALPWLVAELFSAIGSPARVAGRAPMVARYIFSFFSTMRGSSSYAEVRFGKSWKLRPWLLLDIKDLETLEDLINTANDSQVAAFRTSQLSVCGMIAIIGALIAQSAVTALQLPYLDSLHYTCRGIFTMSLIMSILSVFFACLQQRTFGLASEPSAVREWLWNGIRYESSQGPSRLQSSMVAHMILSAPFEIISMALTLFMIGLGLYLGLCMTANLPLDTGGHGNRAVLLAFTIPTFFVLLMFGQLMGTKDLEEANTKRCAGILENDEIKFSLEERIARNHSASDTDVRSPPQPADRGRNGSGNNSDVKSNADGLERALQEAAAAHRQCARADDEVARQFELLSARR